MSNSRTNPTQSLGTQTVSASAVATWTFPDKTTRGNAGNIAALQVNVSGPLVNAGSPFVLNGSDDGQNWVNLGLTSPTLASVTVAQAAETDGVVSLVTTYGATPIVALATAAVSSTVGSLTFLTALQPDLSAMLAGDQITVVGGADAGTYVVLSAQAKPTQAGPGGVYVTTILFTTGSGLTGSSAPSFSIQAGSYAKLTSASGTFTALLPGDELVLTAQDAGAYRVNSVVSTHVLLFATPAGLATATTSQHYSVNTSGPYPQAYMVNVSGYGMPYLQLTLTATSGLAQATCLASGK